MPISARTHLGNRSKSHGMVVKSHNPVSGYRRETHAMYGYWWRVNSRRYLRHNPLCVECLKHGRTRLARAVDHIVPHRGGRRLFRDKRNWQSLYVNHHNQKSAKERKYGG